MHQEILDDDGVNPFDEIGDMGIRQQFVSMMLV